MPVLSLLLPPLALVYSAALGGDLQAFWLSVVMLRKATHTDANGDTKLCCLLPCILTACSTRHQASTRLMVSWQHAAVPACRACTRVPFHSLHRTARATCLHACMPPACLPLRLPRCLPTHLLPASLPCICLPRCLPCSALPGPAVRFPLPSCPAVRYVYHFSLPKSLEGYLQVGGEGWGGWAGGRGGLGWMGGWDVGRRRLAGDRCKSSSPHCWRALLPRYWLPGPSHVGICPQPTAGERAGGARRPHLPLHPILHLRRCRQVTAHVEAERAGDGHAAAAGGQAGGMGCVEGVGGRGCMGWAE